MRRNIMDIQQRFHNELIVVLRGGSQNVKFLGEILHSGAVDINACYDCGITPLQMAAAYGDDEVLALLIANNAVIDEPSSLGWTALMQATRNGHASCMERLIAAGANILLRTRLGVDILTLAAASGSHNAVSCIISTFALNAAGLPPLCFAVLTNETKLVNTMLSIFNSNDMLPSSGLTPLMLATMVGNKHMVTLLCSSGSDVNMRNSLGQTAVDIATIIHDLYVKQFNCLLGKECAASAKPHMLQQISTYKSLIETLKKIDADCNDTIVKQEANIKNSDMKKYLSESCKTASSIEQEACTSAVITDLGMSPYSEKLRICPSSPAYSYAEVISDTQRDSNCSLSPFLSNMLNYDQLGTSPAQNALKDILECRNSPTIDHFVKNETYCSTPTGTFSPVTHRGVQSPLNNFAQHSYPGLCNIEKTASPVLKFSKRLQVASPGNSASFRSPSKHVPHKGNGNRSPLANISRRIF